MGAMKSWTKRRDVATLTEMFWQGTLQGNLRPIFYDTETTGTRPAKDRIVELAAYDPVRKREFCSLINPGCPIPPEATAISKITDEMVQSAPSFREVIEQFMAFCTDDGSSTSDPTLGIVLVAHNNDAFDAPFLAAEFERVSLAMPKWKFFDTLKWARKYRSDLPRHSLQFLREAYAIEANQAHRALDDTLVLHQIFCRMTGDLSMETVLSLLGEEGSSVSRMPFGKYQGKNLADVPKDYLAWLGKNGILDQPEHGALKKQLATLGRIT